MHRDTEILKEPLDETPVTHLEISVHHAHLVAVKHRLQDLLDAMTACKHQGAQVSLSSATFSCTGTGSSQRAG